MSAVVIREAAVGDLDAAAGIIAADAGGTVDEWRGRFAELLSSKHRFFLVALIDGEVIGFGQSRLVVHESTDSDGVAPSGWYLSGVTVAEAHRRKGVGTLLTGARLECLRSVTDTVYYAAEPDNKATIDLHRRFGFSTVGRLERPGYDERLLLEQLHLIDSA